MYHVYILYSVQFGKTYTGYTNNIERRLIGHNITGKSGFTLRYRPWILLRTEVFDVKIDAMKREKFLKTGKGREEIKKYISKFLEDNGAVSATSKPD